MEQRNSAEVISMADRRKRTAEKPPVDRELIGTAASIVSERTALEEMEMKGILSEIDRKRLKELRGK